MSPTCWETNASPGRVRQNVAFCSGPVAKTVSMRTGAPEASAPAASGSANAADSADASADGTAHFNGRGAKPRARRITWSVGPALPAAMTRTTESS